jgi:hypothetical protein
MPRKTTKIFSVLYCYANLANGRLNLAFQGLSFLICSSCRFFLKQSNTKATKVVFGSVMVMVLQWKSNKGVIRIKECHCILCLIEFYNSFWFHYTVCFRSQCNVMEFNHEDWPVLFAAQGRSCYKTQPFRIYAAHVKCNVQWNSNSNVKCLCLSGQHIEPE